MKEETKKPYQQVNRELVMEKIHHMPDLVIDGFVTSPKADFRWLSNFHPCEVEFHGLKFDSTEHAYQAAKTFVLEEQLKIQSASTPNEAKKLGQKVTLRPDWENVKADCMEFILRQKFKAGTELGNKLKSTSPALLIESNWWHDRVWGVCMCPKCNNNGLNTLGNILMKIRDEL